MAEPKTDYHMLFQHKQKKSFQSGFLLEQELSVYAYGFAAIEAEKRKDYLDAMLLHAKTAEKLLEQDPVKTNSTYLIASTHYLKAAEFAKKKGLSAFTEKFDFLASQTFLKTDYRR